MQISYKYQLLKAREKAMGERVFKKRNLFYRWAFYASNDKPDEVSICRLVKRCTAVTFIAAWVSFFAAIIYVGAGIIGFFAAKYPNWGANDPEMFADYPRWPSIGGYRIYPISIILIGMSGWVFWMKRAEFQQDIAPLQDFLAQPEVIMIEVIALIVFSFIIVFNRFRKTESWQIMRIWMKAKKDKVCPTLKFED
jgi:hypothetical protein